MKALDLGCGTGSATAAWPDVVGVDTDPQHEPTILGDFANESTWKEIDNLGPYDFIWFAPDCHYFSMAGTMPFHPITREPTDLCAADEVFKIKIVLKKIQQRSPRLGWMMENPTALMRKMPWVQGFSRVMVTYCQYGDPTRQKRTDFFGDIPQSFYPKSCKNGDPCHEPAPRGSRTGTQGLTRIQAGRMPYDLSYAIYEAAIKSDGHFIPTMDLWS